MLRGAERVAAQFTFTVTATISPACRNCSPHEKAKATW
jgi:hypothetical protein